MIEALYWDKCGDIRLVNANIAVLLYQIRADNIKFMEGSDLAYLLNGTCLNGYRLRSATLMRMFRTNEYAFQGCKTAISGLKYDNLRLMHVT